MGGYGLCLNVPSVSWWGTPEESGELKPVLWRDKLTLHTLGYPTALECHKRFIHTAGPVTSETETTAECDAHITEGTCIYMSHDALQLALGAQHPASTG